MPLTTVRAHFRIVAGQLRHIREHERHIPDCPVKRVARKRRVTGGESLGLFDRDAELRELQDIARQPDGGEISGKLFELAWRMRI